MTPGKVYGLQKLSNLIPMFIETPCKQNLISMFIETPCKQNLHSPITQAVTPLGQVTRDPTSKK